MQRLTLCDFSVKRYFISSITVLNLLFLILYALLINTSLSLCNSPLCHTYVIFLMSLFSLCFHRGSFTFFLTAFSALDLSPTRYTATQSSFLSLSIPCVLIYVRASNNSHNLASTETSSWLAYPSVIAIHSILCSSLVPSALSPSCWFGILSAGTVMSIRFICASS